jgi:hypothetical protein
MRPPLLLFPNFYRAGPWREEGRRSGVAARKIGSTSTHSDAALCLTQRFRRVRKLKTGCGQLAQDLSHRTGNPSAVRGASDQARYSADHQAIVQDVDPATPARRIFNNPSRRSTRSIGLEPRIKNKVRYRQNSPCPGDLSHGGRNESERRTEPGKRLTRFAKRLRNRLITPGKIQPESVDVPQITEPMMESVIYQKMARSCYGPSLFRPGRNLATHHTEARFHLEVA